jgi:hypothetical protein
MKNTGCLLVVTISRDVVHMAHEVTRCSFGWSCCECEAGTEAWGTTSHSRDFLESLATPYAVEVLTLSQHVATHPMCYSETTFR